MCIFMLINVYFYTFLTDLSLVYIRSLTPEKGAGDGRAATGDRGTQRQL